jgi:hypothetical protein
VNPWRTRRDRDRGERGIESSIEVIGRGMFGALGKPGVDRRVTVALGEGHLAGSVQPVGG